MTAIQYPMFTEPIPPANPLMWSETPPTPQQHPPAILSGGAEPSTGGACDFDCGTDVPCSGILDWGLTTAYGTSSPATSGDGTVNNLLYWEVTGLTPDSTYHYRYRVTGLQSPHLVEAVGPDQTFVAV